MSLPLLLLTLALAGGDKPASPKPRTPEKPPRVYTNDDLEAYKERREQEGTPTPSPTPYETAPAPSGDEGGVVAGQAETVRRARETLAAAEAARDQARARVDAIESALNPMSVEFESDPNITLRLQSELPEAREALQAAEAAVESARTELENAEELAKGGGARVVR